ncbi:baculoviral IAP repeat-containing protein 3-like [Musca domestica]|uniref:Baculoviral IAP repeat-containing protein 3-like n=1 Tax=Musca domestica TaxID=7370 RepID=A0ABM3V506_MUSDO|nr:baculoviral IAP repeat-containing protein 3-like [Musca domestica]
MSIVGFYYTGQADRVTCYFCGVEICRWKETDSPLAEHKHYDPPVANAPTALRAVKIGIIVTHDFDINKVILQTRPLIEERLKTFDAWPLINPKPREMAIVGFYYTGQADRVTCYFCGVEICRWKETDSPLAEHKH